MPYAKRVPKVFLLLQSIEFQSDNIFYRWRVWQLNGGVPQPAGWFR